MASIFSMTGFAAAQGLTPLGHVTVELRCVNSRFLDLTMRVSDELRAVEQSVRQAIGRRINRGKLECRVNLNVGLNASVTHVDAQALEALEQLQEAVLARLPGAQPLSVNEVLAYPGVVSQGSVDNDSLIAAVAVIANQALDAFMASREREGLALRDVMLGHCDKIDATVDAIAQKIPDIHAQIKGKLTERLEDALSEALTRTGTLTREDVSDRIRQEVTLYALRMDVEEEINRLRTHVAEVRRVLHAGGTVGRKLDFISQEINREANTLGSKAASIEMTDAAIALKISVDQIREQLQNIE